MAERRAAVDRGAADRGAAVDRTAVDRTAEGEGSSLNLDAVRASLGEAASLLAQVGEAARRAPETAS